LNTGDITSIFYFACSVVYYFKPNSTISNINQAILFRLPELRSLALWWNTIKVTNSKSIFLKRY